MFIRLLKSPRFHLFCKCQAINQFQCLVFLQDNLVTSVYICFYSLLSFLRLTLSLCDIFLVICTFSFYHCFLDEFSYFHFIHLFCTNLLWNNSVENMCVSRGGSRCQCFCEWRYLCMNVLTSICHDRLDEIYST